MQDLNVGREKPLFHFIKQKRLKDLGNNQLILYFAGDHRKNPPWRI